jgi:hypothetical protein
MRNPFKRHIVLLATTVILAGGCEGSVERIKGTGGSGGAGGDGAGGAPSSGTVSQGGTGSASSGIPPHVVCEDFCHAVGDCYANCMNACLTFQAPPCGAEGLALVECMVSAFDSSTCVVAGCDDAVSSLSLCRAGASTECGTVGCGESPGFCACTADCDGGQEKAICTIQSEMAVCTCYLNSLELGTCQGPATPGSGSCNVRSGCCGSLFGS